MDTSTVRAAIDTLGRRVARRRFRSVEEKIKIVAESRVVGASVAEVARRHGVNANQVFSWRRQHEQGVLGQRRRRGRVKLLAVQVSGESEQRVSSQSSTPLVQEVIRSDPFSAPSSFRWQALWPGKMRALWSGTK